MSNGFEQGGGAPPQQKKGLPPLAWVAIGCGVLILFAGVAFVGVSYFAVKKVGQMAAGIEENPAMFAAKAYAALNPEVEVVEADEESQTITFRNTKTGEEITVDVEDVQQGRLTLESKEGKVTVDVEGDDSGEGGTLKVTSDEGTATFRSGAAAAADVPSWVPAYPGAAVEGAMAMSGAEGEGGVLTLATEASIEQVLEFYRERLEAAGYEVQLQTLSGGAGTTAAFVTATLEDPPRTVSVNLARDEGTTQVVVHYGVQ